MKDMLSEEKKFTLLQTTTTSKMPPCEPYVDLCTTNYINVSINKRKKKILNAMLYTRLSQEVVNVSTPNFVQISPFMENEEYNISCIHMAFHSIVRAFSM
jgi:hypothetical protein